MLDEKAELEKIYADLPTEKELPDEELTRFDSFFVGDGSVHLLKVSNKKKSLKSGVACLDDQVTSAKDGLLDEIDFVSSRSLRDADELSEVFIEAKREAYGIFDFLEIKSKSKAGLPIREVDLLYGPDDVYLVQYLQDKIRDWYAVRHMGTLKAFREMGIESVKFLNVDNCPLCIAHHGAIYTIDHLMNVFGRGGYLSHPHCDCELLPIIVRGDYRGLLEGSLDYDKICCGEVTLYGLPREMKSRVFSLLADVPYREVHFVDFRRCPETEGLESDVVLIEEGDVVHIQTQYIGFYNAIDYLEAHHAKDTKVVSVVPTVDPKTLKGEVFLLNGRRVIEHNGEYRDAVTGELVKREEG